MPEEPKRNTRINKKYPNFKAVQLNVDFRLIVSMYKFEHFHLKNKCFPFDVAASNFYKMRRKTVR